MDVFLLPGSLCEGLITCPKESYRLWHVIVCGHETSWYKEAIARTGLWSQRNKQITKCANQRAIIPDKTVPKNPTVATTSQPASQALNN
jgi:hypothetical protein